jgi:hypothetical protein
MAANPAVRPPPSAVPERETSLLRWVWRAYVRNALVPLLVVELLLVAVYLTSHAKSPDRSSRGSRPTSRR